MKTSEPCYVCHRDVEVKAPPQPPKQPAPALCGKSCAEAYNKVRLYKGLTTVLN
jgi:hypothetical protein